MNILKNIWSRRYLATMKPKEWPIVIEAIDITMNSLSKAFYNACIAFINNERQCDGLKVNRSPNTIADNILKTIQCVHIMQYIKTANYIRPKEIVIFERQLLDYVLYNYGDESLKLYHQYNISYANQLALSITMMTDLFETIVDRQCPIDIAMLFLAEPTYELFKRFIFVNAASSFKDSYQTELISKDGKQYYKERLYEMYEDGIARSR